MQARKTRRETVCAPGTEDGTEKEAAAGLRARREALNLPVVVPPDSGGDEAGRTGTEKGKDFPGILDESTLQ